MYRTEVVLGKVGPEEGIVITLPVEVVGVALPVEVAVGYLRVFSELK